MSVNIQITILKRSIPKGIKNMIYLTKIGGKEIILNEDMIESVSQNPDTIVILSNGHSYIVKESMDEIMDRVIAFNRNSRRSIGRRNSEGYSD